VGDGSNSEDEKHKCCCSRWGDTQECYRYHKMGHFARYCPETALVESTAPIKTAVATTTTTISIKVS